MTLITKRMCVALIGIYAIGLAGCNGTSGENGDDPFAEGGADSTPQISLSLNTKLADCSSNNNSFISGDSICVEASLMQDNQALSAEIVSFEAGLGTLSVDTRLTDSNGIAQIQIVSAAGEIGAASIVATYQDATATSNYEFLASDSVVAQQRPELSVFMQLNGAPTSRFIVGQQVTVVADLVDINGEPIVDQIVQFSSSLGQLSPDAVLTSDTGRAQALFTANEGDLGADILTAQFQTEEVTVSDSFNYQVLADDEIAEQVIRFGSFDTSGIFVENQLGVTVEDDNGDVVISAGATLGVSAAIVDENDQRILDSTPIVFSSDCVQSGRATIDTQVNTINGVASSTFEDINCAGANGNLDNIVATLVTANETYTLSREVELLPEDIGSIEFVSAEPQSIILSGTGGQGNTSVSTITFQVNGALGNALAQQQVSFALNTEVGGLSLAPLSGLTNSEGQVSTRVTAGNVPTSVRVTATVVGNDGSEIQTQSDLLAVNTGLPDQNSFSIAPETVNVEGDNINGQQVPISVILADSFNNPVPDGTAVSFTTEGGLIEPSCTTVAGACSVIWTSGEPRTTDHRVTILATAIGHETLFDSNGNNSFDDAENNPINDASESGLGPNPTPQIGFFDMSEAWRDDDEDGIKDPAEIFLDFDNNQSFDQGDTLFNGPQCNSDNFCGQELYSSIHVRKSTVIISSSSEALIDVLRQSNGALVASSYQNNSLIVDEPDLAFGASRSYQLVYSDDALQAIAQGSSIEVSTSFGTVEGDVSFTQANSRVPGQSTADFTLENSLTDEDTEIETTVSIVIRSPSGFESSASFSVTLLAQ